MTDPDDFRDDPALAALLESARPPSLETRLTTVIVDRLLGLASSETLAWERDVVASDPEAARLAGQIERRVRRLTAHTEDPVARFERLTGRRLSP